ncbi:hypothetical protein DPMN_087974 [Dreissena polymorpha]|uniref:Uncharacterized protein n=1 Tax=Dreissena polymorpha TaxID=45954 RepID=A0A9D4KTP3_DREPO|nr:hypothetical protein DPMN_087969 [Dreissena polymorpha]KAH3845689.1 hypothetical protein DPMN_087972 [Dreissena polymorpha]KAH3845691.1 hypothetical protein DPMN_087974 [Dreissena polymorpha]
MVIRIRDYIAGPLEDGTISHGHKKTGLYRRVIRIQDYIALVIRRRDYIAGSYEDGTISQGHKKAGLYRRAIIRRDYIAGS